MSVDPVVVARSGYLTLRDRIDDALRVFLLRRREEIETADRRATLLVEEVLRIVDTGGKRLRPSFCYWGYRAAGAPDDERIIKAAAALELLHTFAMIHDDLVDRSPVRRGVPASWLYLARGARERGLPDPGRFGHAAALLAGDLAAVLADRLLLESGFPPDVLVSALALYHEMRTELASGQILSLTSRPADLEEARRFASMKGGSYTVERPLVIGASLAGAAPSTQARLSRYGAPLGEAFQLRDDLLDGDASPTVTKEVVNRLVEDAKDALDREVLPPEVARALRALADHIAIS